jgi:hypothetical protein
MPPEVLSHIHVAVPVYQLIVYERPSSSGKGKDKYVNAIRTEARRRIDSIIESDDIEVSIVYASTTPVSLRMDIDNTLKPTLDAFSGYCYRDDRQVRAVSARLFDRARPLFVLSESNLIHGLINPLFHSGLGNVVVIHIFCDSRLRAQGIEQVEQRLKAETLAESDRIYRSRKRANIHKGA